MPGRRLTEILVEGGGQYPYQRPRRLVKRDDASIAAGDAISDQFVQTGCVARQLVRVRTEAGANLAKVDTIVAHNPFDDGGAEPVLGSEGAGVVTEVGSAVTDLRPGDRVLGLLSGAFGPHAVARPHCTRSPHRGAALPARCSVHAVD